MDALDVYSVRPRDLQDAEEEVRRCENEWRGAGAIVTDASHVDVARKAAELRQAELDAAVARSRPSLELRYYRLVSLLGWIGVTRCGKVGFIGLASAVVCGLALVASPFFAPTLRTAIAGSLVATFFGACLATAAALGAWPDPWKLQVRDELQRDWIDRRAHAESLRQAAPRAWAGYEALLRHRTLLVRLQEAHRHHRQIADLLASKKYQLIHSDWRSMRGVPFEHFLSEVFQVIGYKVRTTKGSGDQGVDLILTGKGRRIAIQAKGYTGTIGNHAIMEANSGMVFYQCDMCVVITNSDFTRAAKEHAEGVGCLLVNGERIPDLIEGLIL